MSGYRHRRQSERRHRPCDHHTSADLLRTAEYDIDSLLFV